MSEINKKINDKSIIGELTVEGKVYYVDSDKLIYTDINGEYVVVNDKETLQRILEYISPKSVDLEI